MKARASLSLHSNVIKIAILTGLIATTLILGLFGFNEIYEIKANLKHPQLIRWFDTIYSTIRLFSLIESPADKQISHWAVSLARLSAVCTVFFSVALAASITAGNWFRTNILIRFFKHHSIIVGLNTECLVLIDDLLSKGERFIVIESDARNKLIEAVKKRHIAVITGDPTDPQLLQQAAITKANRLILMTENDLLNLSIMQSLIEAPFKPQLNCHIGLDNPMSYKLFEPGAYYSIDNIKNRSSGLLINIHNINENIAIDLVQSLNFHPYESNTTKGDDVKVLVTGESAVGAAIARELLLLGHFCNAGKLAISIVAENSTDFFETYHQVAKHCNGQGLNLWDIHFISKTQALAKTCEFNHIIACQVDENLALKAILKHYDYYNISQSPTKNQHTSFHYYSAQGHDIHHRDIKPFGALSYVASYQSIVCASHEALAIKSHESYVKTKFDNPPGNTSELTKLLIAHDDNCTNSSNFLLWANQPLFKRNSNFVEKRHFKVKLAALGGQPPMAIPDGKFVEDSQLIAKLPYCNEFDDLDFSVLSHWMSAIKQQLKLDDDALVALIHKLAIAEHNRWNAFHIVNNWRYGHNKDEQLKTHDCLLSWPELERLKPDTIKYDYRNIYHIAESIKQLETC